MADLDDLKYNSITEIQVDEAIELLRQIRLSRRVPVSKTKIIRKKSEVPKINSNQAAELLKILGGN